MLLELGMPSLVLAWNQIVSQQCTDLADWLRPVAASEASLWRLTGLPWFHRAGLRPALAGRTHPASHRPTIGGEAVMGSRTLSDIAPPVSSALHAKKQWSPLNWVNNHPIRERFQKTKLPSFWKVILFVRCKPLSPLVGEVAKSCGNIFYKHETATAFYCSTIN